MPAGRPKISLSILWEGWYNDVLDLYREGADDVEVRAMIAEHRIDQEDSKKKTYSWDLWDRFLEDHEEFSETIKTGRLLSEAFFKKIGRKNLENREFNYTGWYMQMKNRFGWKDKQETDITSGGEKIGISTIQWVDGKDS
jgi:hypothetical protein